MKTRTFIPLLLLIALIFWGCNLTDDAPLGPGDDGREETWEVRPFFGELQFQMVNSTSNTPIPNATLQVSNLTFNEAGQNQPVAANEAGLIVVHQLERGTIYRGEGPDQPLFVFTAPGYTSLELDIDDLANLSGFDPYNPAGRPTIKFEDDNGNSQELPLYEFTIALDGPAGTATETAVLPTATAVPPTSTPEPTAEPTEPPAPTLSASALVGPNYSYEGITFSLDLAVVPALYPTLTEEGTQIEFLFAEDGYCNLVGCIQITEIDLDEWWMAETIPNLETAVSNQDTTYQFTSLGAALLMQSNLSFISTSGVQGVRAVTMHAQALFFASNRLIKYEYRGLTPDGRYYIQALIPLSLPFLSDEGLLNQENQPHFAVPLPDTLPDAYEELTVVIFQYNNEVAAILNDTADSTFTPDLALLDQFVSSIIITSE